MSKALADLSKVLGKNSTYGAVIHGVSDAAEEKANVVPTALPKALSKADKLKALKAVEDSLNKKFEVKNSIQRLGSKVGVIMPSISGDLPTVDFGVIGTGGIPRGRIIELFGPESSGKTTIALHYLAQEQKRGELAAIVDAEHALDPTYAAQLGVDVDELLVSQPDSGEQALETVIELVQSRAVTLIVLDSVAALTPQAELDGEMGDAHMGLQARMMGQAMRKLRGICNQNQVTVIFINQIREKLGVMFGSPETTTGGRALKFYASVRLDVRRDSKPENQIKSGDIILGHPIKVKAVKNKVGSPFRNTTVDLIYGVGLDTFADTVSYAKDVGAIQQSGAWFSFGGEQLGQGIKKTIEALRSKPEVMEKVRQEIAKAIAAQREADLQREGA